MNFMNFMNFIEDIYDTIIHSLAWSYLRNGLDIIIVALLFYWVYKFLMNTRAIQLVKGFIIIFIVAIISRLLRLDTMDWILKNLTPSLVVIVVVLFQPELRRLITQFGQKNWISNEFLKDTFPLDEIVNSIISMSEEKVGALIVIERNTGLKSYIESGVVVDAVITEEFIRTIFYPLSPLHDGAIIIQNGRIASAACYLPLSDSRHLSKQHGARHRAGMGISEETDALVLVVSEESGGISIMANGKLFSSINESEIKNMILFFMNPKTAYMESYKI